MYCRLIELEPLIECVNFECSWDGLCWVLLVFQGRRGALLFLFALLGSLVGTGGCGMDCFGCVLGLFGVSSAHWRLSFWAD